MPGMMDTILNLGLNDKNVEVLAKATKNSAFAYDCYRRLLQMYGDVVYGIDSHYFENYLSHYKSKNNLIYDQDLTTRSEEHTSELQSRGHLVCRLLLEKKNK